MIGWEDIQNILALGSSGSTRTIKAKDIKIQIENGQPYIHWIGEFENGDGTFTIDIPRMDVDINAIIEDKPFEFDTHGNFSCPRVSFARTIYANQDGVKYHVFRKKRKMTKKQIEKELGYKIEIDDEGDE